MIKVTVAALVAVAITGVLAVSTHGATSAGAAKPAYEPRLDPKDFSIVVDNRYFPLPVGRTWVYRGVRDGQTQIDRVTVTSKTKLVAEGITARVVRDVAEPGRSRRYRDCDIAGAGRAALGIQCDLRDV